MPAGRQRTPISAFLVSVASLALRALEVRRAAAGW